MSEGDDRVTCRKAVSVAGGFEAAVSSVLPDRPVALGFLPSSVCTFPGDPLPPAPRVVCRSELHKRFFFSCSGMEEVRFMLRAELCNFLKLGR